MLVDLGIESSDEEMPVRLQNILSLCTSDRKESNKQPQIPHEMISDVKSSPKIRMGDNSKTGDN